MTARTRAPRPPGHPRTCWSRIRGRPKVQYSEPVARLTAVKITDDNPGDGPWHAYQCDHCGAWHVGRPGRRSWNADRRGLFDEIGGRAFGNLRAENTGPVELRLQRIADRARRLVPPRLAE